ncbi:MAG: internal scaffolding protein [Microviridae sp.]|nr:MAG: internal scaffolding protein [Microviridae sp.]
MSSNPQNPRLTITDACPFRSAYSPKPRVCLSFDENSRWTKQSAKDECDINQIMSRYMATGELPNIAERAPQYLDVTGLEFQASMDFIAGANTLFHEMPSAIRTRFENNPALFLDFCSHEKNRPELAEMGLLKPITAPVIPNPIPVQNNASESVKPVSAASGNPGS